MKVCSRCHKEKDDEDFFIRNKEKGIKHSHCIPCKRQIDREAYSEDRHDRRTKIRKQSTERILKNRNFVHRVRRLCCCSKCGDKRFYVLDFHHLHDKVDGIGILAAKGVTLKKLKKELRKCIVLCANCHREEHYLNGAKANLVEA